MKKGFKKGQGEISTKKSFQTSRKTRISIPLMLSYPWFEVKKNSSWDIMFIISLKENTAKPRLVTQFFFFGGFFGVLLLFLVAKKPGGKTCLVKEDILSITSLGCKVF
jgi:hypothetical protein